jgi:hypothetical protein
MNGKLSFPAELQDYDWPRTYKSITVSSRALKISALTRAWICPKEPLEANVSLRAPFSSSRLAMKKISTAFFFQAYRQASAKQPIE